MSIDFDPLFTHVPGSYDTMLLTLLLTVRCDSCIIDCAIVLPNQVAYGALTTGDLLVRSSDHHKEVSFMSTSTTCETISLVLYGCQVLNGYQKKMKLTLS